MITRDHDDLKDLIASLRVFIGTRQESPGLLRPARHSRADRGSCLGLDSFGGMRIEPDAEIMENGWSSAGDDRARPEPPSWWSGPVHEVAGNIRPRINLQALLEKQRSWILTACSYARTPDRTPERDVAGLMDFIE